MHFDTLGTHWQDWMIFAGLATLALSFAVAHIVAGRILASVAFGLFALFFLLGDAPQWAGVLIALVFIALNAAQLARMQRSQSNAKLTAQEKALRAWLFPSMGEMDFHHLLKVGNRNIAPAGTFLATQGEHLDQLHVIIQGAAHVVFNGMVVATLRDGSLVGEVSFFRDDVATASVVAQTDLNILSLGRTELRKLMGERDAVKQALHESIGRDLGFKLTAFDQEQSRF
jgi:CRP-like cAMP-binding protein